MNLQSPPHRLAAALRKMIEFIFDPLIFLTMLTPWFMQSAIDWMILSSSPGVGGAEITGVERLFAMAENHAALRGLIDYIVAYTVFLAALILWIALCFNQYLLADYLTLIRNHGRDSEGQYVNTYGVSLILSLLGFVGIMIGFAYCNTHHSMTGTNAVNRYVENVGNFLPPWDSNITWFRGLLALHVAFLVRPIAPKNR